ncbi:hypothetical protein Gotri_012876, partial [Gossypium trilobum]|nr:hypothetical protein [Gossypium trilobum]
MSLMIAPIVDLSYSELWHFVITVLESPIICKALNPIEIPNFKACNLACASVANEVAILIIQIPQQKRRHCSFVPWLKTQGIGERHDYYPPPPDYTGDSEHQQLLFLSL